MSNDQDMKAYKKEDIKREIEQDQPSPKIWDNPRQFYRISKHEEPQLRGVTLYAEPVKGYAKKIQKMEDINIETVEGLEFLMDVKKAIQGDANNPIKIEEDEGMFYYVSPESHEGIIFLDENDAQKLFLDLETTYENIKELEETQKKR